MRRVCRGHEYWSVVESRRVNGKPRPVILRYVGPTRRLISLLLDQVPGGGLRIESYAYGAVAALWQVASEIGLAEILAEHLPAQTRDGRQVGETLILAAIHRALEPGSKRSFAEWAITTSLPGLAHFRPDQLTSQHFWDQMSVVSESALAAIEESLARRLVQDLKLRLDLLFYDTTNFFTYLDSTNERSKLCRRGHNKQKRTDLRQFSLALLVARETWLPLFSSVYEGNQPDQKSFLCLLSALRKRLAVVGPAVDDLTLVLDKGNYSREIQADLKRLKLHWVGSLTSSWHPDLLKIPISEFHEVTLSNGETMLACQLRHQVFDEELTVVVTINEQLRAGQLRGMNEALVNAQQKLGALSDSLATTRRRRRREVVQREIGGLLAREHLKELFRIEVKEEAGRLSLTYEFNEARYEQLKTEVLGKKILFTDQRDWNEREVIEAYHGLGRIERVFRHLKNPYHLAVRPQFHWTDQKIRVHTFCCLLGQILVGLVQRKATAAGIKVSSDQLLDDLSRIREALIIEKSGERGRPRVRRQLEEMTEDLKQLQAATKVVYTDRIS